MGSDYSHESSTQLVDDDSKAGRRASLNLLPYHAYMDYDYNKKPGQDDYEKQQKERLGKLDTYGNSNRAPAKADMQGNLSDRPSQAGLMIRTGESNPTVYTVGKDLEGSEARAVTFLISGHSSQYKEHLLEKSKKIEALYAELDRINILYKQWLASFSTVDMLALWHPAKEYAIKAIAAIIQQGTYQHSHSRVREQLQDIICGSKIYAHFLRAVDLDQGTYVKVVHGGYDLAARIEADIEPLIHDRLSYSHNLTIKFAQARGGETPLHAQSKVFFDNMRQLLAEGEYKLEPIPDGFEIAKDALGHEIGRWEDNQGAYHEEYRPKRTALRLGFIPERSRFVACIREEVEAMARTVAKKDSRLKITTMTQFLRDMKEVDAIVGQNEQHKYDRKVRDPLSETKKDDWYICFPLDRVWPDTFANIRVSSGNNDNIGNIGNIDIDQPAERLYTDELNNTDDKAQQCERAPEANVTNVANVANVTTQNTDIYKNNVIETPDSFDTVPQAWSEGNDLPNCPKCGDNCEVIWNKLQRQIYCIKHPGVMQVVVRSQESELQV
jgi:hypothetical protein